MTTKDVAPLMVLAFAMPVTLGLACVVRDWSLCSPQDHCKPGFVCTEDFHCVRATDGGATDGGTDSAMREDSSGDGAQNQPGGDTAASSERGSDVIGLTGVETGLDAFGLLGTDVGSESPFSPDASSPDIAQTPDVPSGAVDVSPILDGTSSASDTHDAPVDAMAADTGPPGSPLGFACLKPSDCVSDNCSDGVCCDSACTGACQSCALPGKVGACSYVTGLPAPGHPACGGIGTCAGSCSGQSASCSFPSTQTTCGAASCTNAIGYAAPTCDGAGTCSPPPPTPCGEYACGTTACLSSCSDSSQCILGAACASSKCVQCAPGETACPHQCANLQTDNARCGSCSGASSVCSPAQQCSNGLCLLADVQPCAADNQCAAGRCSLFYQDADGDLYPNSLYRMGWCNVSASMVSGYIPARSDQQWDCCDALADVHPGQTQYFANPALGCGTVGYDYNCDGVIEKATMDGAGSTCTLDSESGTCVNQPAPGIPAEDCGTTYGIGSGCGFSGNPPVCVFLTSRAGSTVACH